MSAVLRHRTALARAGLSTPVQALVRHGLVGPTFFDYGCGRGDDVRALAACGVAAAGFDPHYAPDAPRMAAHSVNLGFVLNVIERTDERAAVLQDAWALTEAVLAVAVLTTSARAHGVPCGDGYLTSRATFQKYFTQPELRAFVAHTLGQAAFNVARGVCFVFRDKAAERRFVQGAP